MADPTTSKKVLYSAIGTLGISLVLFYLGNRYGEIIIESGRNFFEYYGTAFSKLLPVVAANPLHLSKEPMAMLCGGAVVDGRRYLIGVTQDLLILKFNTVDQIFTLTPQHQLTVNGNEDNIFDLAAGSKADTVARLPCGVRQIVLSGTPRTVCNARVVPINL